MVDKILYIIVPNALILWVQLSKKSEVGSDHPFHVDIISRVKKNRNKFVQDYILSTNEKNPFYPQLFHWVLSFFSEEVYKRGYRKIQLAIKAGEIIVLNFFVFYLDQRLGFPDITYLFVNIIFNLFPFSYVSWNAKNTGLSARELGLALGYVYSFLMVVYLTEEDNSFLVALFAIAFVSLLSSQMAFQYILFTGIVEAILLSRFEIILLPIMSLFFFYLLMPEVAHKYLVGQFHHKRSMMLYSRHYSLMKTRPSVYRDLVYDFWVHLRKGIANGVRYIKGNPFIELLYGFPFLWFLIFNDGISTLTKNGTIEYYMAVVVFASLIVFVLTSFRPTRVLGEPQRYPEFSIPLITILFVLNFSVKYILMGAGLGLLVIMVNYFLDRKLTNAFKPDVSRNRLLFFLDKFSNDKQEVCISNDHELLKFIAGIGYSICRPDVSSRMNGRNHFEAIFYQGTLKVLNPKELIHYMQNYGANLLVLNTKLYSLEEFPTDHDLTGLESKGVLNEFEVFRITKPVISTV